MMRNHIQKFDKMILFLCERLLTSQNSIIKNAYSNKMLNYYVSGSSSQFINGSVRKTNPEYAFDQIDKNYDWCSNCGRSPDDHPFITFNIKNHIMNLEGYYVKSGCCGDSDCCCFEDNAYCCACGMYSWAFQISNDNITWKTIHQGEKDAEMKRCKEKTFKFSEIYSAKYAKLIHIESCSDDPPCIALNKIELIGTYDNNIIQPESYENEDDDVSIIGHISKNRN